MKNDQIVPADIEKIRSSAECPSLGSVRIYGLHRNVRIRFHDPAEIGKVQRWCPGQQDTCAAGQNLDDRKDLIILLLDLTLKAGYLDTQ